MHQERIDLEFAAVMTRLNYEITYKLFLADDRIAKVKCEVFDYAGFVERVSLLLIFFWFEDLLSKRKETQLEIIYRT